MNYISSLTNIFVNFLSYIYSAVGDLGVTIIVFTLIMRFVLLPLTLPSLKSQKQIQAIQPELAVLKKKHGKDQKAFQAAQLELYKKYNINPLSGCLPQLLQIGALILLYHALTSFLRSDSINTSFLWLNLSVPDTLYVIPVLAGVSQLVLSLMIAPGGEVKDDVPNQSKSKKVQVENKKEENTAQMAAMMQQQILFVMPVMTGFFALGFPSGLGLYWIITTVFSIIQQYFLVGPGGLVIYTRRFLLKVGLIKSPIKTA